MTVKHPIPQNSRTLSRFNPLSWIYFVVRTIVQPQWFWNVITPLFADYRQGRQLFLQSIAGIIGLWVCTLGGAWVVGLCIPEIADYNKIAWWLHSILVIGGTVFTAVLLQTIYDFQKATIYTSAISVFILLYLFMYISAFGVYTTAHFFFIEKAVSVTVLNANIPFTAGLGFYFVIVGILEQQQLKRETTFSIKLLAYGRYGPLLCVWMVCIVTAQYWSLFSLGSFDSLFIYIFGYTLIVACMSFTGALVALLISVRNIYAFKAD